MPFRRRLLTDGEEVVVELRPHWASLGWPLVAMVAAVVAAVGVAAAVPGLPVWGGDALLVVVLVAAAWLSARWLRRRATCLVLTTDRIVTRAGVFGRRGSAVRLDQIAAMSHHQSMFERVLGTGRLVVERAGTGEVVVFDHVPRPGLVERIVSEQLHEAGSPRDSWPGPEVRSPVTPPAGVPVGGGSSVTARLAELAELHRRGLVTDAEYADRRTRLLDQL
jgi:hypothetical protein